MSPPPQLGVHDARAHPAARRRRARQPAGRTPCSPVSVGRHPRGRCHRRRSSVSTTVAAARQTAGRSSAVFAHRAGDTPARHPRGQCHRRRSSVSTTLVLTPPRDGGAPDSRPVERRVRPRGRCHRRRSSVSTTLVFTPPRDGSAPDSRPVERRARTPAGDTREAGVTAAEARCPRRSCSPAARRRRARQPDRRATYGGRAIPAQHRLAGSNSSRTRATPSACRSRVGEHVWRASATAGIEADEHVRRAAEVERHRGAAAADEHVRRAAEVAHHCGAVGGRRTCPLGERAAGRRTCPAARRSPLGERAAGRRTCPAA